MIRNGRFVAPLVALGVAGGVVLCAGVFGPACSSGSSGGNPGIYVDSGGGSDSSTGGETSLGNDAGAALKTWPQPGVSCSNTMQCPGDPGANNVYVTISGESNAISGYPFPPGDWVNDTYFFDGWEFIITEYIVVVDNVVLWSNPNANPTNQGDLSAMKQVAHLSGPFVVDLHKGGAITGQGGAPEQSTPLGVIPNQNDNGGAAFDPATTYGFGFQTVQATYDAYNVNLDTTGQEAADFNTMVQNGYSVFYRGHLTWKGDKSMYPCTTTSAGAGPDAGLLDAGGDAGGVPTYVDGGYDYSKMPNAGIDMVFGFNTPTHYENCQNMTLQGTPNPGEDYPRGLQISTSQATIAQVTVHMDHPFWESFAENSPVHFDQIAAQYVGQTSPVAHVEDMKGVAFYAFTDKTGTPLPWRNCAGPNYTPPGNGQMSFDTLSVPVNPSGTCTGNIGDDYTKDNCPAIRDYVDYLHYSQSTQGHLNSQGLCFIDRHYPAPAGGS
jgi:hypothetical protein